MRRIVVLRRKAMTTEPPAGALEAPSLDAFLGGMQRTPGMTISQKRPVALPGFSPEGAAESPGGAENTYAIEVEFETEEAERQFADANKDVVVGWYANPAIGPFATVCPADPVGDLPDVKARINVAPLHALGHKGKGVRVAIVDTGIDGTLVTIAGGLDAPGFAQPGTSTPGHGTMVAADVRLAAPQADILDYPLLSANFQMLPRLLYDALTVFKALLVERVSDESPMVVVNSWGVHDRREDAPAGTSEHYGSNPQHPFNQLVERLVISGADVLFAAGNCGGTCGFGSCGPLNLGAGNGILGANAHEEVITVGAVTVHGDLLGYSSQGPGRMAIQKPDVVAPSHFASIGVGGTLADTGTSAACGVAGGVVAALRSIPSAQGLEPPVLKGKLLEHARQPDGVADEWNPGTGHGIVDAGATAAAL